MHKELIAFVEGQDDARFIEKIIAPKIDPSLFSKISVYQYSQKTLQKVNDYLKNIRNGYYDYFFLADKDKHLDLSSCREVLCTKYPRADPNRIYMACAEIESWYFAGLTAQKLQEFNIIHHDETTDNLTKENFNALIPPGYDHRLFLIEILNHYDIISARTRNKSFEIFCVSNQANIDCER